MTASAMVLFDRALWTGDPEDVRKLAVALYSGLQRGIYQEQTLEAIAEAVEDVTGVPFPFIDLERVDK